ncbi:hypothetical protein THAOC_02185 [Thalassiosira oceanica]|uniref:Uncharacterized protein n=1 Tax=Thalassiosira oceanica TaxID=159749 RepID=K0TQH8_THAOC|nr:hypothetical protein THAOC_02185 [Thalassiosira oceanica]|eukprot:EJK76072.1 hypothetical protein THAOC_02185 [Thalassiosira oceanica]
MRRLLSADLAAHGATNRVLLPPSGPSGDAGDTNRRRSADRAAIAARSPADSITDTPPSISCTRSTHRQVNPRPYGDSHGCSLGFDMVALRAVCWFTYRKLYLLPASYFVRYQKYYCPARACGVAVGAWRLAARLRLSLARTREKDDKIDKTTERQNYGTIADCFDTNAPPSSADRRQEDTIGVGEGGLGFSCLAESEVVGGWRAAE